MELHQVRYVLAVARAGSFSGAAEELYISQPSLSVQVRKLESELGISLFERLGRRVVLTAAGETFVDHARSALAHLETARESMAEVRDVKRGRVSLGALPSAAASLLPGVLARFSEEHPGVEVRLTEDTASLEFERMVESGALDLALVRSPWTRPGIAGRPLLREPLVALLPPRHRLAGRASIDLSMLAGERFVAIHRDNGLRAVMDRACARAGFSPEVTVETRQLFVLWGMVRSGLGVSVVPELAASGYDAPVRLTDDETRELAVIWRAHSPLSPAVAAFLERLTSDVDRLR